MQELCIKNYNDQFFLSKLYTNIFQFLFFIYKKNSLQFNLSYLVPNMFIVYKHISCSSVHASLIKGKEGQIEQQKKQSEILSFERYILNFEVLNSMLTGSSFWSQQDQNGCRLVVKEEDGETSAATVQSHHLCCGFEFVWSSKSEALCVFI